MVLFRFKRNQQLSGNGLNFVCTLDTIQSWCESLAELISLNSELAKQIDQLIRSQHLYNLAEIQSDLMGVINQLYRMLTTLVVSTFTVEKQPPQVIKTNFKFHCSVRLLVGGKINQHLTNGLPVIKAILINDSKAQEFLRDAKSPKDIVESDGVIFNDTAAMKYDPSKGKLFLNFDGMQIKKIKRAEKSGTESVTDEKSALLFQSRFWFGGGELDVNILFFLI